MSSPKLACLVLPVLLASAASPAFAQLLAGDEHGEAGGRFGDVTANLGDVDGDAIDDFVVGEKLYDGPVKFNLGRVTVYSGATFSILRTHTGTVNFEEFGTTVCAAGDLDGDGRGDYAVGIPRDNTGASSAGRIVVFSGATGGVIWQVYGTTIGEALGERLASIADEDGDGRPELIVGRWIASEARILDSDGGTLLTLTDAPGTSFGQSVASCGDVDGDGVRDFLVGAPTHGYGAGSLFLGRVDVYSGANAALIDSFEGDAEDDRLGWSVAGIGDVDGDGVPDLMAGAPNSSKAAAIGGYVRVVSGSTRATLRTDAGPAANDKYGWSCAGFGDFDGDGVDDYAAGAIGGGASSLGMARVYSGATGGTLWDFEGVADSSGTNTFLGQSLIGGDFDGDAYGDVAIGDHYFVDFGGSNYGGGVWLHRGCPAWSASYGAGWPGRFGVPGLDALQDPQVGSPIDVAVGNSLGADTVALMFVGVTQIDVPTSADGHLLVAPLFSFAFALPAAGATLAGVLPSDPALYFVDVDLQALEADPYASKNLSFTAGLQLHLGFDLP